MNAPDRPLAPAQRTEHNRPLPAAVPAPSGPAATPLLTLHRAAVRFGATQALQPLDLVLHRGERLALVGANGSGKTTLLRLIHGLLPHEGERRLHAAPGLAAPPPAAPGDGGGSRAAPGRHRPPVIAMLFQRPFVLSLSVRRNMAIALWLRGVPADERAARSALALARVGLADLADRPARALSGGQQQRLALARAWALQPDVLLLDEPTASLDPSAKREVETLVDEFGRDGTTVVMSTHNLGQAKRLATRVAYLEAGRLLVDRPVDAFFHDPLPTAAAQFLRGELPWP